MDGNDRKDRDEVFTKVLRAGKRTYFFDVRSTKADDYYLTITESRKQNDEQGGAFFKKHKIYLYKEDLREFKDILEEITDFIIESKGEEIISDTPSEFRPNEDATETTNRTKDEGRTQSFTDIDFDDL